MNCLVTFLHYYSFQVYTRKVFILLSLSLIQDYTFTILLFSTQSSLLYYILILEFSLQLPFYIFTLLSIHWVSIYTFIVKFKITHLPFYFFQTNSLYNIISKQLYMVSYHGNQNQIKGSTFRFQLRNQVYLFTQFMVITYLQTALFLACPRTSIIYNLQGEQILSR